MQNTKA